MLGAVIGAGISALGSYLGAQSQADAAQANAANNIALQKQFAKNAIQWRVADAEKAGIHPLYALGASTTSFSPVSVGSSGADPLAASLSSMGQDLTRAAAANRSTDDRMAALSKLGTEQQIRANELKLSNMELQNTILAKKVQDLIGASTPPGAPGAADNYLIPGQGSTSGIKPDALKVAPAGGAPSGEAGAITDIGWARTSTGWAPVPSKDVKERIEDQAIPEFMWALRNNILPSFGINQVPPPTKPPEGKEWRWNWLRQEYQLFDKSSSYMRRFW